MTTDFTVRPARPADARRLAELRWTFKQEDHEGRPPAPARPLEEAEHWIRDRLRDGHWLAWVAETEGEVCGHAFLCLVERMPEPYLDNNPYGYVTNFFVLPSQRNKGAGSALLEALKQHACSAGLEGLIVWPSERSTPLYQGFGFQPPEGLLELPLDT
ncbi:GNAT family N-acetyltransferase [Streptomyces sp. NBC_01294]|uniref:GNAT family N-acetyltransferase n=1 Tax=Streptomyces sp. NBC_01294 TaxID=2903815 RepID=UPI002DD917C3|nr:GNAT family N-acetyltransferase [Streptomyces sp. NBC_01294]WRZ55186.1 GNAT family N-acetyltransferase [Streptomyces sp. NBC_01294]WRZ61518.1 GNAT family N-acetyltransferase [Streptomyces sp. NBC_01294]